MVSLSSRSTGRWHGLARPKVLRQMEDAVRRYKFIAVELSAQNKRLPRLSIPIGDPQGTCDSLTSFLRGETNCK